MRTPEELKQQLESINPVREPELYGQVFGALVDAAQRERARLVGDAAGDVFGNPSNAERGRHDDPRHVCEDCPRVPKGSPF